MRRWLKPSIARCIQRKINETFAKKVMFENLLLSGIWCCLITIVVSTGCTRTNATLICIHLIYEPVYEKMNHFQARNYCASKGGNLAKITSDILMDNSQESLSSFLNTSAKRVWIGMSDRLEEGNWTWHDGTPVDSAVLEAVNPLFRLLFGWHDDCGFLTFKPPEWTWEMTVCNQRNTFLCEMPYVANPENVQTKSSMRKSVNRKRREQLVSVIKKAEESVRIIGVSVLDQRVASYTMCARLCLKSVSCKLINFRKSTRECRGFSVESVQGYDDDPHWEIWRVHKEKK